MGDCLLLEAKTGELVLCDGGMASSIESHVSEELSRLRDQGREIEYVYISHIDSDHISGVLQLLEDEVEWRVFDHHRATGSPVREPKVARPPVIKGILHNAFRDQVPRKSEEIENVLAATAPSLFATGVPELVAAAEDLQSIATSIPEAIKVSRLVAADALDIPLNRPPNSSGPAKLLFDGQPGSVFALGSMNFTLIGPTSKELEALRKGWNTWLEENKNKDRVKKIRAELKKRIDEFSNGALSGSPFDLGGWNGIPSHKGVTAPNVASLMYLVEEEGKRILLTGDAQQDFILDGLQRTGQMPNGWIHLDVLKVQHHGSEHNLDPGFAKKVSADHYVFCGNGASGNPEPRVLDFIYNSRLGPQSARTGAPHAADRPFHFWFSTTSQVPSDTRAHDNFVKLERHVAALVQRSGGILATHFNDQASIVLDI